MPPVSTEAQVLTSRKRSPLIARWQRRQHLTNGVTDPGCQHPRKTAALSHSH